MYVGGGDDSTHLTRIANDRNDTMLDQWSHIANSRGEYPSFMSSIGGGFVRETGRRIQMVEKTIVRDTV